MITVLLVDDHASVRKSLSYLLEVEEDIQVMSIATNGVEAVEQVRAHCPDVVVMDISMPVMDGIEATRQICMYCSYTRVVMLSIFDHPEYVQRALDVGAVGFVLKDAIGNDLLAAVRALHRGRQYFSEQIAAIARQYIEQKGKDAGAQ